MIVIKYLYIGIDDTDSPDGMCTTYLASQIINEFKDNAIELVDYPRLIRLNPFARFKTRGNGGVSLKILNNEKADLAREIVLEPFMSSLQLRKQKNLENLSVVKFINSKKAGGLSDQLLQLACHYLIILMSCLHIEVRIIMVQNVKLIMNQFI